MRSERQAWVWTWIVASLPFIGYWATGLLDLDEGFYAAVIREMLNSGDWIVPRYNGLPWFEKPILPYWIAAPLVTVFGDTLGPRLGSVLCSLATIGAVAWFLNRRIDGFAGRRFVVIFASTLLMLIVGRLLLADPPMILFQTLAMICFIESLLGSSRWRWAAGMAVGLAVLAKGPVSAFFFIVVVLATLFGLKDFRPKLKGGWTGCVIGFAAAVSTWFVPIYLREPKLFIDDFILKQNVYRLLGGDDAHRVPLAVYLPYYVIILIVGFSPWWWHALKTWREPTESQSTDHAIRFVMKSWALAVFILFTLSGSKLPHYIAPAIIPLGVLAAMRLGAFDKRKASPLEGISLSLGGVICAAFLVYFFQFVQYQNSGQRMAHQLVAFAKSRNAPLVVYQLRARERSVKVSTTVQETTLPSINFYYGKPPIEAETLAQLLSVDGPAYVLTRPNRDMVSVRAALATTGKELVRVRAVQTADLFQLYWMGPKGSFVPEPKKKPEPMSGRDHDHAKKPSER